MSNIGIITKEIKVKIEKSFSLALYRYINKQGTKVPIIKEPEFPKNKSPLRLRAVTKNKEKIRYNIKFFNS